MKVIADSCHGEIEAHLHVLLSGWAQVPGSDKPVLIVRVDYHDPKNGREMQGVSIPVVAP